MIKTIIFLIATLLITNCSEAEALTYCRSNSVKHQFDKINGYPHGRPGYVVDQGTSNNVTLLTAYN